MSELGREGVTDKHNQWSDSGPIIRHSSTLAQVGQKNVVFSANSFDSPQGEDGGQLRNIHSFKQFTSPCSLRYSFLTQCCVFEHNRCAWSTISGQISRGEINVSLINDIRHVLFHTWLKMPQFTAQGWRVRDPHSTRSVLMLFASKGTGSNSRKIWVLLGC